MVGTPYFLLAVFGFLVYRALKRANRAAPNAPSLPGDIPPALGSGQPSSAT
jgi:hypothetical protein